MRGARDGDRSLLVFAGWTPVVDSTLKPAEHAPSSIGRNNAALVYQSPAAFGAPLSTFEVSESTSPRAPPLPEVSNQSILMSVVRFLWQKLAGQNRRTTSRVSSHLHLVHLYNENWQFLLFPSSIANDSRHEYSNAITGRGRSLHFTSLPRGKMRTARSRPSYQPR